MKASTAGVLGAAALLAACDRAPTREQAAARPAATATSAATSAAVAQTSGLPTSNGETLRGDISGLRGDVSGFERRETATRVILSVAADTLFAFDRADLSPDAQTNLAKVADAIRAGGAGEVAITGYTDAKGSPAYNQSLSERRARAVADWMGEQVGVRLRHFVVTGKGEADPVAPNTRPDGSDSPEGRARNRRVEISIPK